MAMNRLALRAVPGTRRTPPAQVQGGNSTLTPPSLSKLPGSELGGGGPPVLTHQCYILWHYSARSVTQK